MTAYSDRPILFSLLLLSTLIFSPSFGCFSSGDPAAQRNTPPESAKLRRAEQIVDNRVTSSAENGNEPEFEVDRAFVRDYLKEFGHLSGGRDEELSQGIKHFQELMGFKQTGKVDLPMLARMSWKRCANPDRGYSDAPQIWERTTLFWTLDTPIPSGFPFGLQDMKELIRQAFAAWEIVIAMDFVETNNPADAQIAFVIEDEKAATMARGQVPARNRTGKTGLAIASASSPPLSRIWLNKHENWSTFQTQEESKIDIFLVLIHEIGHSLGLKHSGDEQSVMFPMFERLVGEQLPVISNDDVERLRALYESSSERADLPPDAAAGHEHAPSGPPNGQPPPRSPPAPIGGPNAAVPPPPPPSAQKDNAGGPPEKCPHSIVAAANVNPESLYVFHGGNSWLFKQGKISGGPSAISEVFPDGPASVDVAFTAGRLTILIKSRTVFGYEFDPEHGGKFTRAKGFPRELHNRILFFPEAAFPIANGSIILIKDKVFATYNAETNTPHMLGNVDEFFPNLPQGLRSGFPASPDFSIYHMLTPEYAFLYDVRISRSVGSQSIGQFLGCDSPPGGIQPLVPQGPPQSAFPLRPSLQPGITKSSQQGGQPIQGMGWPGHGQRRR